MPLSSTGNAAIDLEIARRVRYLQSRWAEGILAALMIAVGLALLAPGATFELQSFRVIARLMGETQAGAVAVVIGTLRIWALKRNGALPNGGPLFRLLGCAVGGMFWAGWLFGFAATSPPVVPLLPMAAVLAVSEILSGNRVIMDAFAYDAFGLRKSPPEWLRKIGL